MPTADRQSDALVGRLIELNPAEEAPDVAARRIVTLRDGQIQSDVPIQTEFERDLIDLKHSALGQAILQNNGLPDDLRRFLGGLPGRLAYLLGPGYRFLATSDMLDAMTAENARK